MEYTRTTVTDGPIRNAGPYEAIIVNHLDPSMQGTLEVELLRYGSASSIPERSGQLVIVKYLSPFYGVTSAKGVTDNDGFELGFLLSITDNDDNCEMLSNLYTLIWPELMPLIPLPQGLN